MPVIDYGNTVYMTANKTTLNKLQKIQNITFRVILKADKWESVSHMHSQLKLPKLDDRRNYHLAVLAHKNRYIEEKTGRSKYFVKINPNQQRNTRHANEMNLIILRINSDNRCRAIEFRGPMTWNKVEASLKLINKLTSFKLELLKRITSEFDNHPT